MNEESISFCVAVSMVAMWTTFFSIKTHISLIEKISWVWETKNILENSGEGHRPLSLPEPNNWSCFRIELFWWGVINLIFPPQLLNLGDSMSEGGACCMSHSHHLPVLEESEGACSCVFPPRGTKMTVGCWWVTVPFHLRTSVFPLLGSLGAMLSAYKNIGSSVS